MYAQIKSWKLLSSFPRRTMCGFEVPDEQSIQNPELITKIQERGDRLTKNPDGCGGSKPVWGDCNPNDPFILWKISSAWNDNFAPRISANLPLYLFYKRVLGVVAILHTARWKRSASWRCAVHYSLNPPIHLCKISCFTEDTSPPQKSQRTSKVPRSNTW